MWPRVSEILIGCWLAASPWIFGYGSSSNGPVLTTFACAALTVLLAAASYFPRMERAHLGEIPVAAWLIAVAFLQADPPPAPSYQNFVCVGLLMLLFAIIPSRASQPPRAWREFHAQPNHQ